MEGVPGPDVFAFARLENEADDFANGFLSTGYDLYDRLFAGFLVNGAKNLSVGLGESFVSLFRFMIGDFRTVLDEALVANFIFVYVGFFLFQLIFFFIMSKMFLGVMIYSWKVHKEEKQEQEL